ncbi:MAG TPA: GGDEF domain-containing protein, partial [Candidatus Baltobacteraceae bacterium]
MLYVTVLGTLPVLLRPISPATYSTFTTGVDFAALSLTAVMLFGHLRTNRGVPFAMLFATYLTMGVLAVAQLVFPLESRGLVASSLVAFPLGILLYVTFERLIGSRGDSSERALRIVGFLCAALLSFSALVFGFSALERSTALFAIGVVLLHALALTIALTWASKRTSLRLWLLVALWASALEAALFAIVGSHNFPLSRYASSIDALIACTTVLLSVLSETTVLYGRLANLASHDDLTGLPNRRAFDERFDYVLSHAHRHASTVTMMVIDIDFFKAFNDRYGHLRGDQALQEVSQAIMSCLGRKTDMVARFGGEEFVVLLGASTEAGATEFAERIRVAVKNRKLPNPDSNFGVITVSIGIAS